MLTYNEVDTKPSRECPSKLWIPSLAKEMDQWKSLVYKRQIDLMELKRMEGLQSLQYRRGRCQARTLLCPLLPNQNPRSNQDNKQAGDVLTANKRKYLQRMAKTAGKSQILQG
jgi:hypothetical protein